MSASEIEAVLQDHPAVISTCVVGVPDDKVGERIKAYVVLKEDIKGITGYELTSGAARRWSLTRCPSTSSFGTCCPNPRWANCCGARSGTRNRGAEG